MNNRSIEVPLYVAEMVDYLADRLPENPKIARKVIAELARRRGRGCHEKILATLIVAAFAAIVALGVEDWLDELRDATPRHEARLIELPTGEVRLNVVRVEPGRPVKILSFRSLTGAQAEALAASPGWEVRAIQEMLPVASLGLSGAL